MRPTAMLTLGRLPKGLDIARALSGAGYRVIVAEPYTWHLCRLSRHVSRSFQTPAPNTDQQAYLDELETIIRREGVSLVIPISEEIMHAALVKDCLGEGVTFFGPHYEQLANVHDKGSFIGLARGFGLTVPETYLLGTDDAKRLAGEKDYILKPVHGCSGEGLLLASAGDPLPSETGMPPTLVQQRLYGPHKSTFAIAHKGRLLGNVIYRGAIFSDTVAVAFERLENEAVIEDWVRCFVSRTGWSGFLAFDFIDDHTGVSRAIECNPRVTSGVHFMERGDLARAIVSPGCVDKIAFKREKRLQQFFPSLTETQAALFRRNQAREKAKVLFTTKDPGFAWSDPLPLVTMPFTSLGIMRRAFLEGQSFGMASTRDIAWTGLSSRS